MSQDKNQLILDVKNLVVRYETEDGIVHALNGIDLQLGYRQTIGLVGETGAGKTTAALAILRLVPDPPGVVECDRLMIEGRDILNLPAAKMDEVRGKDVSMIFQDPMTALNPVFTVGSRSPRACSSMRAWIKTPPWSGPSKCWSWWVSPGSGPTNTPINSPGA